MAKPLNSPTEEQLARLKTFVPPDLLGDFRRGVAEFNLQEFFECHETLESVWQKQLSDRREITQGIIQVAVGYYHLGRGNTLGAKKLFDRGLTRLKKFENEPTGLDLKSLCTQVKLHDQAIAVDFDLADNFSYPLLHYA